MTFSHDKFAFAPTNSLEGYKEKVAGTEDVPCGQNDLTGYRPEISTKERTILSMEMRGMRKSEIAQALQTTVWVVSRITNSKRYVDFRNKLLAEEDERFFALKGKAIDAVDAGLTHLNIDARLRAAEMWFRARGYGGYSKGAIDVPVSAEDVVQKLLQVNVQVNVGESGGEKD